MQDNPGDISYFQYIQAQQFPHLNQFQPNPYTVSQIPTEIYENPSEHYACINNYGPVPNNKVIQNLPGHRLLNSSFSNHGPQPNNKLMDVNKVPANFYGYATEDYGASGSELENDVDPNPSSSLIGEDWAESSHSDRETEVVDKPNGNRPLPSPPFLPKENQRKPSLHDLVPQTG